MNEPTDLKPLCSRGNTHMGIGRAGAVGSHCSRKRPHACGAAQVRMALHNGA